MDTTQTDQNAPGVPMPPPKPFLVSLKSTLKETFLPDDPFRDFSKERVPKRILLFLKYFIPLLEWLPQYNLNLFKSDLIAGITITSLAVPQGISYANLAQIPPIIGLYSSFVPPLVYVFFGSSKDLAIGTVAVVSLLLAAVLGREVSPTERTTEYVNLVFTATFVSGVLQASLGFLRLGFIVDLLSHATIVGFMGGAASVVCLQQLKGILGLKHFTQKTDIISVMKAVFTQTHDWRWQTIVFGACFLALLFTTRYISKKKPAFFWIHALAPLFSVIFGSLLVFGFSGDEHGIPVVGKLKQGLNPISIGNLTFTSPNTMTAVKVGIITGTIGLAEGVAVGRSFAAFKNYHIDGNKEMVAFGMMNIIGSFFSCYLTSGPFSRTAVNFNAGCKTAVSNIIMAIGVMLTLLFLTQLFYYTPLVVLSAIIITAVVGLIDIQSVIHLYKIDKYDFTVCICAYLGVVIGSIETGLMVAVALSILRVLLFAARPKTCVLGNMPNSTFYRSIDQYPDCKIVPGILILQIEAPILFTNSAYLRERITRWVENEDERLQSISSPTSLHFLILELSAIPGIDTSGITMLQEVKSRLEKKGRKLVLSNPRSEVIKKLYKSKFVEAISQEWLYLSLEAAVDSCKLMLTTNKASTSTNRPNTDTAQVPASEELGEENIA